MDHSIGQQPVADRHERHGQGDGDHQQQGVDQRFAQLPHGTPGRSQVVGDAHGAHEGVGCPGREVNGEEQAEEHQPQAGVFPHIGEINVNEVHNLQRENFPQGLQYFRHIQMQKAQQGADENQKRKDGKEQVKGQSGAVDAHVVAQVALNHEVYAPQKAVFRQRRHIQ